jgi:hypothetical protein
MYFRERGSRISSILASEFEDRSSDRSWEKTWLAEKEISWGCYKSELVVVPCLHED